MTILSDSQFASIRKRLDIKVERGAANDCWPWKAHAKTAFGYGRMNAGRGVNLKAHRAAYLAWVGPIPDGLCVLHACDNPPCCNPAHLFLGTKQDNIADMTAKGRWKARGPATRPRENTNSMTRGERNGNSVLNEATVRAIRAFQGSAVKASMALNVGVGACYGVKSGKTWKHVA